MPRKAEVFASKKLDDIGLCLNRYKTRSDPRLGSQVIGVATRTEGIDPSAPSLVYSPVDEGVDWKEIILMNDELSGWRLFPHSPSLH